jgi:hypothetical protein
MSAFKSEVPQKISLVVVDTTKELEAAVIAAAERITTISSSKDMEEANESIKNLKLYTDFIEESRVAVKKPWAEAVKEIDALAKNQAAKAFEQINRLKKLIGGWVSRQEAVQLQEVRQQGAPISTASPGPGVTAVEEIHFEVTDARAAFQAMPDLFELVPKRREIIAALKEGVEIPGVRSWKEKSVRVRGQ